jgi:glycosyltransferase involved in cell wall biosynthesis
MKSDSHSRQNARRLCVLFLPDLAKTTVITTVTSTLSLLEPITQKIFVITGAFPEDAIKNEKIRIINISVKSGEFAQSPVLIRFFKFLLIQLKMSYQLFRIAGSIDVVFLAAGTQALFFPTLTAKVLRKKVIFSHLGLTASSQSRIGARTGYQLMYDKTLFGLGKYIFPWFVEILERFNYLLADRIIIFLSSYTSPLLKGREKKVIFGGSRFYVDIEAFKVEKDLTTRETLVGFIGRFDEIKGIMNFVKAIPLVMKESAGIKFLIGGDGLLRGEIEKELKNSGLSDKVVLAGWIAHDKLPQYLNNIKLLVIPSYGEIGPHMVFEAMACGTPVLGTPVGVMRDVIKDGETGFILEDNSPECITRNIFRALNHPNLAQIARSARSLIEREYTYEAAVERYRKVLESLG